MSMQEITALMLHYRYFIMFCFMFLEGPIVAFLSAFLAAQWYFDFGIVYILSVSGDVAWDLLRYRIGRFGRQLGIKKIDVLAQKRNLVSKNLFSWLGALGEWIRFKLHIFESAPILKYLQDHIAKRFFISLLIVKITPPLSVPGQFSFGFLKVSFWKFLLQTTFVCFLFESIFLNLWYFSSISVNTFKDRFDSVTTIITSVCIAIVALLIGFFIIRRFTSMTKRLK